MDFNATIDLIIKDLNDAREIIDDLKKYPGVPVLQVELAKSKCKSAGEVIALLKNLQENAHISKEEPAQSLKHPLITEEIKSPPISPKFISKPEKKKDEVTPSEIPPSLVETKDDSVKTRKKASESTIIADRFIHLSGNFNEQMGTHKNEYNISDTRMSKPLTSLPESIGVNDKFMFIREIFNGNEEAYFQAISRLESAKSIEDARAVIMSLTGDNSENEAVQQLLDLVKRKLSSHE